MNSRAFIGLSILALAASVGALTLADVPAQRQLGLRLSPFATDSVIIIHALATLPLSLLIARNWAWLVPQIVLFAVGVGGIALTIAGGAAAGPYLDEHTTGFVKRALLRTAWCISLQLPWCMLACRQLTAVPSSISANDQRFEGWPIILAATIACAMPTLYVVHLTDRQAAQLSELRERMQLARALPIAESICQLGRQRAEKAPMPSGPELPDSTDFQTIRDDLRRQVRKLEDEVNLPIPTDASTHVFVQRARALAQLDRLNESMAILRRISNENVEAMLLLATVLQDLERWLESDEWYQRALARRLQLLKADARQLIGATAVTSGGPMSLWARNLVVADLKRAIDDCIEAYDGLAFNARNRRDFAEGERWYRQAIEKLPAAKAHFHFQLGRHFEVAGRPAAAVEQFREAARLDPPHFNSKAELRIRKLQNDTPACFFGGHAPSESKGKSR